jgi:hypothetical protein
MEIIPGVGVDAVRIGQDRAEVEARLGPPAPDGPDDRAVYPAASPALTVGYDADGLVAGVDLAYAEGEDHVSVDGVRLTHRFADDVVADLARRGHAGTAVDNGFAFRAGFAVFALATLAPVDVDPDTGADDDRLVVDAVSVAPYRRFVEPAPAYPAARPEGGGPGGAADEVAGQQELPLDT